MKKRYYFDHAATSWPKAPGVPQAVAAYLSDVGSNVGRGAYQSAYAAEEVLLETREKLCKLFGGGDPRNVVLTPGCTWSLNTVLRGLLRPGDRVVTSRMEHNAVLRPLHLLEAEGVEVDYLPCNGRGELLLEEAPAHITGGTRLVVLTHASNVCGTLLPIREIGALCRARGVYFCVDAAQTAGLLPLDVGELGIDALAFPGHKHLLGPQGVGGLILSPALAAELTPLAAGGTGSVSDSLDMPDFLPDKLEAGSLNLPGIYGLHAALLWREGQDMEDLRRREEKRTGHLLARLGEYEEDGLRVLGVRDAARQAGVVSVLFPNVDNAEAARRLAEDYGVETRCGLHCAPMAHRTLGTFPGGTVRFSIGPFTRFEDIDYVQGAVGEIIGGT